MILALCNKSKRGSQRRLSWREQRDGTHASEVVASKEEENKVSRSLDPEADFALFIVKHQLEIPPWTTEELTQERTRFNHTKDKAPMPVQDLVSTEDARVLEVCLGG